MVRFFLTVCLLLTFVTAWGQVEELPELNQEELRDNWMQKLYDELADADALLSLNTRIRILPEYTYALYSMQCKSKEVQLNLNLRSRDDKTAYANFQVHRNSAKSHLNEFALGSLTPAWAKGLVLKQSNKFRLGKAANPDYISPQGVGAVFSYEKYNAFVVAARQQRSAKLIDGQISTLYSSRRDDANKVTESLACVGMETKIKALQLGGMAYIQSYDLLFSNPLYSRQMEAISIAAGISNKVFMIDCEMAVIEGKPAVKTELGITQKGLKQSLGYSISTNNRFPAYASSPGILSKQGEHSEVSWDLDCPVSGSLEFKLRNAMSRDNSSLSSPARLSRNILYISYKPNATKLTLQLSRYDKELIAQTDSSYVATLPVHYRINTKISHSISRNLDVCFNYRYHYQDQLTKKRNSFYWENYLVFNNKKLGLTAGLRSWQTLHSVAVPDESLGDEYGIYVSTSEDNQVFARLSYRWRKAHINTELRQSCLDGYRSIYLNLGI